MDNLLLILEIPLVLLSLLSLLTFIAILAFTWAWAQQQDRGVSLTEILSVTANEWGTILICFILQLIPSRNFYEAPPLGNIPAAPQQIPIIFVPSLHTRSGIFLPFSWKLKNLFFNSLWFFDWHFFLKDPGLLQDELAQFIDEVLSRTEAQRFRVISFGSSRPIVSKVLESQSRSSYCEQWIAISSPDQLGGFQKMLLSKRMKCAYEDQREIGQKQSDLAFYGRKDLFFTEPALSKSSHEAHSFATGHFGCLFEVEMIDKVVEYLSREKDTRSIG